VVKHQQALKYSVVLAPDASSTNARTANLDCKGADYATILLSASAEANTNATGVVLSLLESDDTVATNFQTFSTNHSVTLDNTAAAVHAFHVDMDGRKRYLRLSVTPDTTTNGAVLVSAQGILDLEIKNASNSDNADSVSVS
jgi:hypothetical protein